MQTSFKKVHVQHGLFKFNCLENTTPGTLDHRKQNSPSKQTCELEEKEEDSRKLLYVCSRNYSARRLTAAA